MAKTVGTVRFNEKSKVKFFSLNLMVLSVVTPYCNIDE